MRDFLFKYNGLVQQDNDNMDQMAISKCHHIDISNDDKLSGIYLHADLSAFFNG